MKKTKIILIINIVLLILTPLGYLTIAPGIALHVTVGVFQLIIYGFLLWELKNLSSLSRKLLAIYSIGLVIIIGVTLINFDEYGVFSWIGSYVIAIYFSVILGIINKRTTKIAQL